MKLPPFQLERFFARHEFSAPYLLCSSDLESVAVSDLLALEPDATERLHSLWLGYTETTGDPTLRAEIATIYATISPEAGAGPRRRRRGHLQLHAGHAGSGRSRDRAVARIPVAGRDRTQHRLRRHALAHALRR